MLSIDCVALTGRHGKICRFAGRGWSGVCRHRLIAVVAGCATVLRAVVQLAYQPALIFPDSERYLAYAWHFVNGHWAPDWLRTSGYSLLLIPAVRMALIQWRVRQAPVYRRVFSAAAVGLSYGCASAAFRTSTARLPDASAADRTSTARLPSAAAP